ncbi:cysteine proteinase [Xylariaceae sp. FL0594]|nr:cysteine proteinase [Xylariaceae sp. FL0594]
MRSHPSERLSNRQGMYSYSSLDSESSSLWDRLWEPSVVLPLGLVLFTVFYQSLHSTSQLSHVRHPGELLWDLVITVTPARLLYALDRWLNPPAFPLPKDISSPQPTSHAAKSELLRRVVGIDRSGSIMNAVALAGKKGISSLSQAALPMAKRTNDNPPGLGNSDNSCFQNSILQGLSSLKSFATYLADALDDGKLQGRISETSSTATLLDLLKRLADSQNNGATLWTPAKLKSLDTWQQQDAQEYYSKILDEIDKEVRATAQPLCRSPGLEAAVLHDDTAESQHSDDSGYQSLATNSKPTSERRYPRNPLEGLVAQRVACVQCGHFEGLSMIPFNCVTLSLRVGQGDRDLYERLDAFTSLERIGGVECAKCTLVKAERLLGLIVKQSREAGLPQESLKEPLARLAAVRTALEEENFDEQTLLNKCKISKPNRVSTTKTKQMVIGRAPLNLAIHLNRSVFDENTGIMYKNPAAVRFPSILDLGAWCLGSRSVEDDVNPDPAQSDEESWSASPTSSMIAGGLTSSKLSGPIYELRAVVTHQGRHENGHYICYRKHPFEEAMSAKAEGDEQHSECENTERPQKWWRLSDESVVEVSEESVLAQGGVFMLFYERVDPSSVILSNDLDDEVPALDFSSASSSSLSSATYVEPENYTNTDMPGDGSQDVWDGQRAEERVIQQDDELADFVPCRVSNSSSLLPLLKEGEDIESTIPLRWPNS